jgi:DNA-binding response OmpR family regulator
VGADDYVTKPFSMRELVARLKAMLRRTHMDADDSTASRPLTAGPIVVDPGQRRVMRRGKEIQLKPKEFDLLTYFVRHPGQVFSREQLLDQVWGFGYVGDNRTVDVHIRWLREKIEKNPSKPKLLETIRGVGYRLHAEDKTERIELIERAERIETSDAQSGKAGKRAKGREAQAEALV